MHSLYAEPNKAKRNQQVCQNIPRLLKEILQNSNNPGKILTSYITQLTIHTCVCTIAKFICTTVCMQMCGFTLIKYTEMTCTGWHVIQLHLSVTQSLIYLNHYHTSIIITPMYRTHTNIKYKHKQINFVVATSLHTLN